MFIHILLQTFGNRIGNDLLSVKTPKYYKPIIRLFYMVHSIP